jgi:acetyl-CoA acetyltransferase
MRTRSTSGFGAAICGIGMTPMGRFPEATPMGMAMDAFSLALDDAGLEKADVDGLLMLSFGADYDRVLEALGLNVRHTFQGWNHGRFSVSLVQQAAMAIKAGMADTVAIVHGRSGKAYGQSDDGQVWRQGLGPHGESPAHGALAPVYGAAIAAQRYFHRYGGGNEALAPVAVALRRHATLNPGALRRTPLTVEEHQASPWIAEPLRRLDCCQVNDGGACVILTSSERARDLRQAPVEVLGMQGIHAGPEYHNMALPGLGVAQQSEFTHRPDDLRVYAQAGVTRDDIDGIATYDAFTPLVLFALERFGFCGPGEAMEFVRDGHTELGGKLPLNTSGGLMSEGHLSGWNLWVELVRQLRHEAGARQIPDAELLQWAGFLGESVILGRG